MDAGYGMELDVMLTRDSQVVVVHDPDLTRLTGRRAHVARHTYDELRTLPLLGTDSHMPLLGDVLDLVAGRTPVMVEVKSFERRAGALEQAVLDVIRDYDGPITVASFNPSTVGWFSIAAPDVLRGQTAATFRDSPMPFWLRPLLGGAVFNLRTRPHYLSYELEGLPNRAATFWRDRGLPIVTWTVKDDSGLAHARAHADNLIFENVRP